MPQTISTSRKTIVTWDDLYKIKFTNTRMLRSAAITFEEKGRYCPYSEGDPLREDWWDEEERKSLYGDWFPIGPGGEMIYIPGYFYFYLNYCPILKNEDNQDNEDEAYNNNITVNEDGMIEFVDYELIKADRIEGFPDFWDGDFWHFKYIDDAERHGKFGVELKRRGIGASFKAAGMGNRNYFLIPKSRSFFIANEKQFLLGSDGVLQKAWDMMNFIDNNTDWAKRRQFSNAQLEKRASYKENIDGVEVEQGFKSSISGITTKNDVGKVRGLRGKYIYMEEAGKDPHFLEKFIILKNSVKQQRKVFGFILGSGTGGQEGSDFEGLTEVLKNPDGYNVYGVPNVWDHGMSHKKTGYFWPTQLSAEGFIDADGNSDMVLATAFEMAERKKAEKNSTDRTALVRHIAENPFNIREATLNIERSILPIDILMDQLSVVETDDMMKYYGRNGMLFRTGDGKIKFKESDKYIPIDDYPWKMKDKEDGCIVIYDSPVKVNGVVPSGMYILVNDPYYHDKSTGPSLGATYIYKCINNVSTYNMDTIVASYVGRPRTLDEYTRNMFLLAEYYNAKMSFEIDRGRHVLDYAKRHKKLNMLQREFDYKYNSAIPKPSIKRGWGFKMSSGADDPIRRIGEQYLADWLLRERSIDENGKARLNAHTIKDRALLLELIAYGNGGNFDRVDAMIQLMYFTKEIEMKPRRTQQYSDSDYFSAQRTARFYQHAKWY